MDGTCGGAILHAEHNMHVLASRARREAIPARSPPSLWVTDEVALLLCFFRMHAHTLALHLQLVLSTHTAEQHPAARCLPCFSTMAAKLLFVARPCHARVERELGVEPRYAHNL